MVKRVEPDRNVYIGHRYVPLLVGEWDKSIQYEGLSIVTFEGNSYTSKKMTPPGIDIENEEYWVVTGNYDAQVEYYRQETERVSQEIESKIDIEHLNSFKTVVNDDINSFKTDINDDINIFKTDINEDIDSFKTVTNEKIKNKADKEELYYNISDFGAFLDGETDDSDTFQNALDSISNSGGGVLLIPGTVALGKKINLRSNVIIKGQHINTSRIISLPGHNQTMFDTTQGTGNRIWFGFENIRIDARESYRFMLVNNAYYHFYNEVQVDGHDEIDGMEINTQGIFGYHGIFYKTRFNNFRKSIIGNVSANANRFLQCWFYGGRIGIELAGGNGNTISDCTFQNYTELGIWLNDDDSGATTRNIMENNYFEPINNLDSVIGGIRLSGKAQYNEIRGGKYSNLRGNGKPEILYDNDHVRSRNLRQEYNGQSRQEVMIDPTYRKLVEFNESSLPTALDDYLGTLAYIKDDGQREHIKAVLRERTGTRAWADFIFSMNGSVDFRGNNLQNPGSIVQSSDGYIRLGRRETSNPTEGDMYYDNTLKRVRVYSNGSWKSLNFET